MKNINKSEENNITKAKFFVEKKFNQKALFAFNCKLSFDSVFQNGFIIVTKDSLYKVVEESEGCYNLFIYEHLKIKEIKYVLTQSYVAIECLYDKNELEICRSDLSDKLTYSYFVKTYKEVLSGYVKIEDAEFKTILTSCPKCGRPYKIGSDVCNFCFKKKDVIKRVKQIIGDQFSLILVAFLLFLTTSILSIIVPIIQKDLVDNYIKTSAPQNIFFIDLFIVVLSLAIIEISISLISMLRNVIFAKVSKKTIVRLRSLIYQKIQLLSLKAVSTRTVGDLLSRVTSDTETVSTFISEDLPNLIEQVLMFIVVGTVMFFYNYKLAFLILIPAPLVIIMFRCVWKFMRRLYHRQWLAQSEANTVLNDIFQGVRVVKVFGTEQKEIQKYNKEIETVRDISIRNEVLWSKIMPYTNFFLEIGSFIVLYFGGREILNESMTLGELTMFSYFVSMIYGPLRWMARMPRKLQRATTSLSKVLEIVDEDVDISDKKEAKKFIFEGKVDIEDIHFGYDSTKNILEGISLSVKTGEMLGIVGRSGVGKSTLINLIMRMYDVEKGSIKIDGCDIRDISQNCLRSQIGVVLQETFLFSGNIFDNISYAKPDATREEVIYASKLANAHNFIMKLPDGYNTYVGEKGYTLSGGERQRIAIARAILHDPKIIILDEATSALDTENEKLIQDALQKLIKNKTTFAIAHRLSTLRNATKLVVLDKGKVAEIGSHNELMKQEGLYYQLVMAQRQMSKIEK